MHNVITLYMLKSVNNLIFLKKAGLTNLANPLLSILSRITSINTSSYGCFGVAPGPAASTAVPDPGVLPASAPAAPPAAAPIAKLAFSWA